MLATWRGSQTATTRLLLAATPWPWGRNTRPSAVPPRPVSGSAEAVCVPAASWPANLSIPFSVATTACDPSDEIATFDTARGGLDVEVEPRWLVARFTPAGVVSAAGFVAVTVTPYL